jgi:hypothetical protein
VAQNEGQAFCTSCPFGTEPDIINQTCNLLEERVDIVLYILVVSSLFIFGSLYLYHLKYYKRSQPAVLGLMGLTLVDFISDWLFIYSLSSSEGFLARLRIASMVFTLFPMLCNGALSFRSLRDQEVHNPSFLQWIKENQLSAAVATMFGALNVELITLMESRLFHKPMFSAPIPEADVFKLQSLGLVTNLLEDLPQIIIQGLALSTGRVNPTTIVSMSLSGMALLQGIMGRGNSYLLSRYAGHKHRTRSGSVVNQQAGGGNGSAVQGSSNAEGLGIELGNLGSNAERKSNKEAMSALSTSTNDASSDSKVNKAGSSGSTSANGEDEEAPEMRAVAARSALLVEAIKQFNSEEIEQFLQMEQVQRRLESLRGKQKEQGFSVRIKPE